MKSNALTMQQHRAMPFLLECRSIEDASKLSGTSTKQIFEWMKDAVFMRELNYLRSSILDGVVNRLRQAALLATDVIVECLKNEDDRIKLKAADQILNHLAKFNEITVTEQRLTQLENNQMETS